MSDTIKAQQSLSRPCAVSVSRTTRLQEKIACLRNSRIMMAAVTVPKQIDADEAKHVAHDIRVRARLPVSPT